jgi:cell division septation protein DedD
MALLIFFTIVTSLTIKRGTSLLCNQQTKIASDMASQKTMRSFFQTSKPAEISTNKKPRQEESVKNVHAPPSSFALSSHSGPAIDDDGDSSCSPSGLTNEVWRKKLATEFSKPYFVKLSAFVEEERARYNVYPPKAQVYAAFNLCSFDEIKVMTLSI